MLSQFAFDNVPIYPLPSVLQIQQARQNPDVNEVQPVLLDSEHPTGDDCAKPTVLGG